MWQILAVEPSPADVRWLRLVLEESGVEFELVSFPSAVAALAGLDGSPGPYDAVIVNYHLPCLDIADAVARLREMPAVEHATIAVTIALPVERDLLPPGCVPLMKPVDIDQIKALFPPEYAVANYA